MTMKKNKRQQHTVGNSTTFCEQSWFIYIYMGMCFEPSWLKADKQMVNSFTVVLFWKCDLNAITEQGLEAQNITPALQADSKPGH